MAPKEKDPNPAMFAKDEKVLCFHHELLYEAKVLDLERSDKKDKTSPFHYRIHYKGWKNTWDDWVPQDRLRKLTDDNKELAANLKKDLIQQSKPPAASKNPMAGAKRARASEISSSRDGTPANRGNKRTKDNDIQLEQDFVSRPMIKLPLPDTLKSLLVDDWEFVTKQMLLVPVPSKAPANFILDSYFEDEKSMRRLGSAEADILEEVVQGLKVYFERSVGKVLLYRFEREQWSEKRQLWESGKYKDWEGKGPGDAYGAEHLTRMLVNMPEMIAQTNMDAQAINRLREELGKFSHWLARNSPKYFCAKYEKPSEEYVERAGR